MSNIDLNEESPLGKPWKRCNKTELVNMIYQCSHEIYKMKSIIYWRDLYYNPCHESERLNKGL